ncbi:hypothetical protein CU669_17880 [Paramagnetospirillum kuznetsovii]|uniref:Uncharacterized protein n=1 Tax=Paramagnetospirillum kuznetsovii TaxID=2053833 RepID=A0A364NUC4_9PROT|nr:hypothetical protein [Paramagnetospirillum kuznetsovii]RAU20515.1 hypothetical protein CU669_17880 [Paramagnetospirillum kuznetsovii]
MTEVAVTIALIAPLPGLAPRQMRMLASALAQKLRRNRKSRAAIGLRLDQCPKTAVQALTWAREWCRTHDSFYEAILVDGRLVATRTIKSDGSSFLLALDRPFTDTISRKMPLG